MFFNGSSLLARLFFGVGILIRVWGWLLIVNITINLCLRLGFRGIGYQPA